MLIKHDALIPFPLDQVYDAFLAGMEKLPPWLPSIDKIEVTRFESPTAHQSSVDYKWHLDNTIVPVLLRPFLKQNMDHICSTTLWCAQKRVVEFEFYHTAYRDLFDCKGTFSLHEHSHSTMRIEIYAELNPYPERMPGLPVWISKRSIPLIEKLIGDILKPSLLALPAAGCRLPAAGCRLPCMPLPHLRLTLHRHLLLTRKSTLKTTTVLKCAQHKIKQKITGNHHEKRTHHVI